MPDDILIDPASTVNSMMARHPATLAVLNAFGVDMCCGGTLSLEDAARADGIELQRLLDALADSVRSGHAVA